MKLAVLSLASPSRLIPIMITSAPPTPVSSLRSWSLTSGLSHPAAIVRMPW